MYGEGIDCDHCIDESVISWGDKLFQTGRAGLTGMLGRYARAARRVVFTRAHWAAAFKVDVDVTVSL